MANNTVDTRVVRMEFDNKQFEKNVKQTSKSLDNLKQNLDFKGVGDSIDKVKVKISALQVVATTFVVNLTNKLITLGTTLVKSLSVDNISAGWAKFGEKTTSVATMMAQKIRIAGQEITNLAEKTAVVNEQLELLTWFSDETSYSFTDMVNNVGKFTAAGQDLDKSVKAMEGIATWAALSGQNAQTASRAMYQLAQAMGKGKIQRIDWMSIQNANMDTEEFREKILEVAVALGELTKEGDNFVTKTGKKFSQSQFTEFLSEGWFTSDVLIQGLNKYSAAIDEIYEIAQREGITASEVIEKFGDQLDEFGVKAFKAAQEARTFRDVLNSVKDAVSSKWMTTFENIFGGQEQAVKLWTELANELYDVFAESGNFRNNILKVWNEFGGRDDIFGEHGTENQGAFWNLYDAIIAVRDLIRKAWNTVFPISMMEDASDKAEDIGRQLKDLTKRIKDFTNKIRLSEETSQRLSKVFQIIFSLLKVGAVTLKTIRFIIDPLIEFAKQLVGEILDQMVYSMNMLFKSGNKLEALAIRLQSILADLLDSLNAPAILDEIFSFIRGIFSLLGDLKPIETVTRIIGDFIDSFKAAGGTSENFAKIIKAIVSLLSIVRKIVFGLTSLLFKTVVPVLNDIIDLIAKIAGFILGTIVKVVSVVMDLITDINTALSGNKSAIGFGNQIFDILDQLGSIAKSLVPVLGSLVRIILKMVEVILLIPKLLNNISKRITGNDLLENLNKLEALAIRLQSILADLLDSLNAPAILDEIFSFIRGIFSLLGDLKPIETVTRIIGDFIDSFKAAGGTSENFAKIIKAIVSLLSIVRKIVFGLTSLLFKTVVPVLNDIIDLIAKIAGFILGTIVKVVSVVMDLITDINTALSGNKSAIGFGNQIFDILDQLGSIAKSLVPVLGSLVRIILKMVEVILLIPKLLNNISKRITGNDLLENLNKLFDGIVNAISTFINGVKSNQPKAGSIEGLFLALRSVFEGLIEVLKGLMMVAQALLTILGAALKKIGLALQYIGKTFIDIFSGNLENLTKAEKSLLAAITSLWAIAILLITLYNIYWLIVAVIKPWSVLVDSVTGLMDSFARSSMFGIVYLLAQSLLQFAIALMLIGAMNPQTLARSVAVAMSFITLMGAFILAFALITKNFNAISEEETSLRKIVSKKRNNKGNNMIAQMAAFIASFGNTLLKIAISLRIIGKLDRDALARGVETLIVVFGLIAGLMFVLKKTEKVEGGKTISITGSLVKTMVAMATAILTMALAFRAIAKLSWENLAKALTAFAAFIGSFVLITYVMGKNRKKVQSVIPAGSQFLGLAAFMLAFVIAIKSLAKMKISSLFITIGAIVLLIAAFTAAAIMINKYSKEINIKMVKGEFGKYTGMGTAMLALAASLMLVVASIALLGLIPKNRLWKGIAAAITIITALALAVKMITLNNKGSTLKKATSVTVILGALVVALLSVSLISVALALVPFGKIILGIVSMSLMLAGLVAAVSFLHKSMSAKKLKTVLKTIVLMGAIIGALYLMSGTLMMLASVPWQSLLVSIAVMILALGSLVGAMYAMTKMASSSDTAMAVIKMSAAFAILSVALIPLAYALNMFASVPLAGIGKGLLTMAASMVILGLAAVILKPVINVVVMLAASILMVGVALLAAGVGLQALVVGLQMLADSFGDSLGTISTLIAGVVSGVINGLLEAIPQILTCVKDVISAIIDALIELFPKILELVFLILDGVLILGNEYVPQFIELAKNSSILIIDAVLEILNSRGSAIIHTVVNLFAVLLEEIALAMDKIGSSVMTIVVGLLSALNDSMDEIVSLIVSMILKVIDGLTQSIRPLIQSIVEFLIALFDALKDYIGPLVDSLVDFVFTVIVKVIQAITQKIIPLAGLLANVFLITIAAMLRIVIASLGALSKLMITFVTALLLLIAYTVTGLANVLVQVFLVIVKECLKALIKAIFAFQSIFANLGSIILRLILSGLLNLLYGSFKWVLEIIDFIFGTNMADKVQSAIDGINNKLQDGALKAVDNISGSLQTVQKEMKNASTNINEVVSMTSSAANEAVVDGMSQIGTTVTDSMDQLGSALSSYGEQAGANLTAGLGSSENQQGAYNTGVKLMENVAEGTQDEAEMHSPSRLFARFGNFLMEGLGLGIQNGASTTENAMAEVISDSLQLATDILDGQDGDDYTIKVGMDISSVEAQTSKIQDMMSGVNDPSITASGKNAGYNARTLDRNNSKGSDTVNNDNSTTVTYNNTFNIESTDPQQSADEIDKVLKEQNTRFKLAHGT